MAARDAVLALGASLLIAGCVSADMPRRTAPETAGSGSYVALGTEPGWRLDITPERIDYRGDYGETLISVANPGARPSFNGRRYVTERLTVDITHGECNDGMSDRRYSDTVTVMADTKIARGCGGTILPPADLDGTSWSFVSIGGISLNRGMSAELRFEGGRILGSAACNHFSGPYEIEGALLRAGTLALTRKACAADTMALDDDLLALLEAPVRLSFLANGRLTLVGRDGRTAVVERAI